MAPAPVAGCNLVLDRGDERLELGLGSDIEQRAADARYDAAHEVGPAAGERRARSISPYDVPTRCTGPSAERLDQRGEVVLVLAAGRRAGDRARFGCGRGG